MKLFGTIVKITTALAAIAGAVYVIATYGDKVVTWAKKLMGSCPCCAKKAPADEAVEEVAAEVVEAAAEEPVEAPAVEAAEPAAEIADPDEAPVAEPADFEA